MTIYLSRELRVADLQAKALRRQFPKGRMYLSDPPARGVTLVTKDQLPYGALSPVFYVPEPSHRKHGEPGFAVVRTRFHGGGIVSRHWTEEAAEKAARRWVIKDCTCGCCEVVRRDELENLPGIEKNDRNGYSPYDVCV